MKFPCEESLNSTELHRFLNFFDFDYELENGNIRLIDLQGANLGGICDELYQSINDVIGRFQYSIYIDDYINRMVEDEFNVDISEMSYKEIIESELFDKLDEDMQFIIKTFETFDDDLEYQKQNLEDIEYTQQYDDPCA